MSRHIIADGNEAVAAVAYQASDVIAIYPITPASRMGELADAWSAAKRPNLLGTVPRVIQMQSEAGAAAVLHGALQAGALSTTFTASQGLLLMIPEMFKIAGELTPTVFHVAARTVATHALSIFGDHSDVMAVRSTGWALLSSSSVQEAQDLALVAQAATLRSRVPFLHFFDGFRTSHETSKIESLDPQQVREMIDADQVRAHRLRCLDPERPVLRGSAQNPDVFFQAREAANPFYLAVPRIVSEEMARFGALTGRRYQAFDRIGHPEADRVLVMMGSGSGAAEEAVEALVARGERVALVRVRLFRPFDAASFVAAIPATARAIAVLDRTKEPGALGEPLYQDVVTALAEAWPEAPPPGVIGGRYGLSSKEFTPAMACAVFHELEQRQPRRHFTVGIVDDVTHLSLNWDPAFPPGPPGVTSAVFYGLGSDGTVSAARNTVQIIGEATDLHVQGYSVYDSRKAGAVTVSHLRFGARPIRSSYLVRDADLVACHQFRFLERMDVLDLAAPGGIFLLNCPYAAGEAWDRLPLEAQRQIIARKLQFFVVDANRIARDAGLGETIGTIMQPCYFALAGILPQADAMERIRNAIRRSYGKRGETVVQRNLAAVDRALEAMAEVSVPAEATSSGRRLDPVPQTAPDFVRRVTAMMIAGKGDLLPVSALPVDGTFPVGTARFEKRSIASQIPIWDPKVCVDCGLCALVCPHAAIRCKVFEPAAMEGAPEGFLARPWSGKEFAGKWTAIQVAPDDCTGCGVCVDVCPARSKEVARHKAINMEPKVDHLERERSNFDFFQHIAPADRRDVRLDTIKGASVLEPLFEFSGACAGCGETPYLKLLTQLFGDRILVANATGCSSIYGGNLPTTPWSCDAAGRGPAWCNSLFEDNAEFGLGLRLAIDARLQYAHILLERLSDRVGSELVRAVLDAGQEGESAIHEQRQRVAQLKARLAEMDRPEARELLSVADVLVRRSVWIVGGDGWAYDIGFGGLDHVLAGGHDVKVLVLDTEVYSNTGGQASKATPRAAVAKFASAGKPAGKKDLGMLAMAYGSVYVAQVAMGANPQQALRSFMEAESYRGPSLIIAYSPCIAHGIDMTTAMSCQKQAVSTGYWPLYRYDPRLAHAGDHPLRLDSRRPTRPFREFAATEARFAMLTHANPTGAGHLMELAQRDIDERWRYYEQMAGVERTLSEPNVMEQPS